MIYKADLEEFVAALENLQRSISNGTSFNSAQVRRSIMTILDFIGTEKYSSMIETERKKAK